MYAFIKHIHLHVPIWIHRSTCIHTYVCLKCVFMYIHTQNICQYMSVNVYICIHEDMCMHAYI